MKKVAVWGIDSEYSAKYNTLKLEILKGNIEVVGVGGGGRKYLDYLDGFRVYEQSELFSLDYDYLLVFNGAFQIVINNIVKAGVDRKKIVNGKLFEIPNFDFILYTNLIEDPVTIFSDDCWGGMISHYLFLPLNSPLVNLRFAKADYLKFLSDPDYYLNSELICEREGNIHSCIIPCGSIGEGDKKITLAFNHHVNFAGAAADWNRRKGRVNKNNLFVKMTLDNPDRNLLEAFEKLPYEKKAVFAPAKLPEYPSSVYLPRYIERCLNDAIHFGSDTHSSYARTPIELVKSVDLLKLLNGMPDFRRDS